MIDALRRGDQAAFAALMARYHSGLHRLAMLYVADAALADEVVQETWMAVLVGVPRFAARSSLKTWIFRILLNCARKRGKREARVVPFSALRVADAGGDDVGFALDRFDEQGISFAALCRCQPSPEEWAISAEARRHALAAIATLPPSQRQVLTLRDVEGWSATEVCAALKVSEANQRVLLHRGRARVRRALASYFAEDSLAS